MFERYWTKYSIEYGHYFEDIFVLDKIQVYIPCNNLHTQVKLLYYQ